MLFGPFLLPYPLPCPPVAGTIGCYASKCTRTYHCACARQSNCAFVGNFVAVYCAQHAYLKDTHQGTDLVRSPTLPHRYARNAQKPVRCAFFVSAFDGHALMCL